MKIETGKFYRNANGGKVGPMCVWSGSAWHYIGSDGVFRDDGTSVGGDDPDLIAEWTDTPHPFKKLSDTEKGALLLAQHEGKRIEVWCFYFGNYEWRPSERKSLLDHMAYRITPTRVTGTVKLDADGNPDFDTGEVGV